MAAIDRSSPIRFGQSGLLSRATRSRDFRHGLLGPSQRSLVWFALLLVGLWIPLLLDRGAIGSVAELHALAQAPNPYFVPGHAWLLYVRAPLAAISAWVLCLSPGLLLTPSLRDDIGVNRWLLYSFGLSLIIISPLVALAQALAGSPITGSAFVALLVVISSLCFLVTFFRVTADASLRWPIAKARFLTHMLFLLGGAWMLSALLTPKLYWEVFNGDGAETYETARRLLHHALPFWPSEAGELSEYPSITSLLGLYPASWFIRLFGEYEASVRLPVVFLCVLAVAGVTLLARRPNQEPLGLPERILIRLVVAITVVVLGYHASYNPYVADLASPALHDFTQIVCFLGFVHAFVVGKPGWICLWTCLTYLSWPSGVLLIVLWLAGTVCLWRTPSRKSAVVAAGALSCCFVGSAGLPWLLHSIGVAAPGEVNSFGALWDRATPIGQVLSFKVLLGREHLRRLVYLLVPSGILPALSLVLWRKLDVVGRTMAFTIVGYFAFFYLQRNAVLHHFAPIMVLPLVVFWRADLQIRRRHRTVFLVTTALFAFLSLGLALPRSLPVITKERDLGATIAIRFPGYEHSDPSSFARSAILHHAFPFTWDILQPGRDYGGSALAWNYYAHQPKALDVPTHYILQPARDKPPEGMHLLATESNTALYVSGLEQVRRDRSSPPPPLDGSPLFRQHLARLLGW